jgi:hypothetical protein
LGEKNDGGFVAQTKVCGYQAAIASSLLSCPAKISPEISHYLELEILFEEQHKYEPEYKRTGPQCQYANHNPHKG